MTGQSFARFKRWFWRPPRPHGEIIPDRTVSSLELFYDLVYVAVIAQAAHHLAEQVSARATIEFAVVFAMIWIAWVNGTIYLELHGREDGRTRSVVFVQMGIIAVMAIFTAAAAEGSGAAFALAYAGFLAFMTWLWYTVRREDRRARPEFLAVTGGYVVGGLVSVAVIFGSAFLPPEPRLVVWVGYAVAWIGGILLVGSRARMGLDRAVRPTDSLVERFGLFTIIVLGEVVFGVVAGMSSADHDVKTISTGVLALLLGFGFWWMYFDVIGRRLPRDDGPAITIWLLSHFPITLSIAASGAAMVSLIEHAHDPSTPAETAWLLAGAVSLGLLAQAITASSLVDAERLAVVYGPLTIAMVGGAVMALIVGWLQPAPWLLALLLVAILSTLWLFAVSRYLRVDAWGETRSRAD